jgi:hypothetical protein
VCCAQSPAAPDPASNTAGLPAYVKLLPQPAPEPYQRITEKQRLALYASNTFGPWVRQWVAPSAKA